MYMYMFWFENRVPLMPKGRSVVWHTSLPLMNSFIKMEAAIFLMQACFLSISLFLRLIYTE